MPLISASKHLNHFPHLHNSLPYNIWRTLSQRPHPLFHQYTRSFYRLFQTHPVNHYPVHVPLAESLQKVFSSHSSSVYLSSSLQIQEIRHNPEYNPIRHIVRKQVPSKPHLVKNQTFLSTYY